MLGAIAGDIIGSVYESWPTKQTDFPLFHPHCRFTDDTVLTVALADTLLTGDDWIDNLKLYCRRYPGAGYGGTFAKWAWSNIREPYNSWGNGSAMRVSPVGFACDTLEAVLAEAQRSAEATHNHPEGIKGAQATAAAIFLARSGATREAIREYVIGTFRYDLSRTIDEIRPDYRFDVSCWGTVPPAILAALESESYEDAVRKAISLGGDSDTLASITGGIAQALYGKVPAEIAERVWTYLDDGLTEVVREFCKRFDCS